MPLYELVGELENSPAYYKDLCQHYAEEAEQSAQNASTSEQNASASEQNASASAQTATTQAGIATTQAGLASASALSASGYATTASNKASEASNSASTATTQAGIATTKAGEASNSATNALNSANTASSQAGIATTQAGLASGSATSASASADLAEKWANYMDGTVDDTEYSAKYYATESANSASSASNSADIAESYADYIEETAVKIDIDDKRISNIEKLLQGNLYDYQTDTDSKYTKTVPSGAMPYASLDSIGGKTVVWNQLVDSGTTTVNTISGHKYYTLINGTASIITSDGTAISVVDDTADMVCDLTLMMGSGNEFANTSDFTAVFPATHYSYNAGTLLSAGVTEVVSKGMNLAYFGDGLGQPSNTASHSATKRKFEIGKYVKGLYTGNSYVEAYVTSLDVQGVNISFKSSDNGVGVGIPFNCVGGSAYAFSCELSITPVYSIISVNWYAEDGTYLSCVMAGNGAKSFTATAPNNAVQGVVVLRPPINTLVTYYNIQIEKSSSVTPYSPAGVIATYPIPAEIRSLEGYGWSAGSVFNYIDYEAKKFIQNVGRVDLGTLSWAYSYNRFSADVPNMNTTTTTRLDGLTCIYPIDTNSFIDESMTDKTCKRYAGKVLIKDSAYTTTSAFTTAMSGVYLYYELATPVEVDISAYLTDDNLISVESGGTLTFPNSNGTDYQIPVPSSETYMVDLQSAI